MKQFSWTALALLAATLPMVASPIEATFTGVNGAIDFGYYVGPFYGKLSSQSVPLYCIDFANDVSFGEQWAANLSHIDTQPDLANTRYGSTPGAVQLYQEAAWLTEQYGTNSGSAYGDIQATIWQLFDSFAPEASSNYWLHQAQANYQSVSYNDFFVVTNTGPVNPTGQVQEFLTVLNPSSSIYKAVAPAVVTSTPEPRLMGVLGLGLICAGVLVRSLRRARRERIQPVSHRNPGI